MNYLLVALGNIGVEYENTRHNIGFNIADEIAKEQGVSFELKRLAFYTNFKRKAKTIHLIKPTTYMNLSGKALVYWKNHLKISIENILVIVDDVDLNFGILRIKAKGSAGGHNGLKDIEAMLASQHYNRLRFGIGHNFGRGQMVQYVLGKWTDKEQEELPSYIIEASKATYLFIDLGMPRVMEEVNKKQ